MTLQLHRAAFAAAAILFGLAVTAPLALAQNTGEDPVATCRAAHASDANAQIACLERAIDQLRGTVREQAQAVEQAQQQLQQQQAEPARPAWSIPGFRAREEARRDESVRVQVVRVRYGRDGLGIFTMADGQVWQETVAAPERRHLESGETYEAVIDRGPFGGFRMNVDGIRWEYRVEPLN